MEITKETILNELNNMKSALENSLNEKNTQSIKNVDEKIDALNGKIEELKSMKPEVSAEELTTLKSDVSAIIKGFDLLQTRMTEKAVAKPTTLGGVISKSMTENKSSIVNISKDKNAKFIIKDVHDMQTDTTLDGNIPNTYRPGIVPQPFEMVHARSIFPVTPSETDSYHFFRHTGGEGALAFQRDEGESKAQFDEDLVEETVNLNYLAGFLKVSRKMLRNFTALQSYISRWLPEKYYNAEDAQVMTALSSATGQVGSGADVLEILIKTIGAQRQAKYNVNAIVVNGATWSELLVVKTSAGEYTIPAGTVTIAPNGQMMICGVPVYVASWVSTLKAIVCDTNYFTIVQSEGLSLMFSEFDADNFQKNKVTARVEASVGFALLDSAAVSIVDFS